MPQNLINVFLQSNFCWNCLFLSCYFRKYISLIPNLNISNFEARKWKNFGRKIRLLQKIHLYEYASISIVFKFEWHLLNEKMLMWHKNKARDLRCLCLKTEAMVNLISDIGTQSVHGFCKSNIQNISTRFLLIHSYSKCMQCHRNVKKVSQTSNGNV